MNDVKIVECEVCMEKFPLDCFEFFPCTHKICFFCYNNLKQLQCPYCRINIDIDIRIKKNNSLITIDEEENNENNENNGSKKKKKKKKKKNLDNLDPNIKIFDNEQMVIVSSSSNESDNTLLSINLE